MYTYRNIYIHCNCNQLVLRTYFFLHLFWRTMHLFLFSSCMCYITKRYIYIYICVCVCLCVSGQVMLIAQSPLTFVIHPFRSSLLAGSLDCILFLRRPNVLVFIGRSALVCPCLGVHRRISIMNLFFLLQQFWDVVFDLLSLWDGRKVAVQLLLCEVLLYIYMEVNDGKESDSMEENWKTK